MKVCPRCGSNDYIILMARNDDHETIAEHFLCKCEYSANVDKLTNKIFWLTKLKKMFMFVFKGK